METTPRRRRLSIGLAIVLVLALAAPVHAITTQHPSDADAGEYPFAVALVDAGGDSYDGQFCGGTLIDPTHVLTAAHCVTTEDGRVISPGSVDAVLGQTSLSSTNGERIVAVGIAVHPDYDPWTTANDIAIIELASPASVKPAGLADSSTAAAGTTATVVGWGEDAQGGYPDELQEADVTLVGDVDCSRVFAGEFDPESMLCAGDSRPGGEGDSCYGDSGGPLLVQTDDGAKVVGVVSWGYECDGDFPGVYAEVASSGEWIGGVLDGTIDPETEGADPGDGGFPDDEFPEGDVPWDEFPEGDDPWDDAPFDEELTDEMIADIQAVDRALMEALDAAGIDYEVVEDEIGAYPLFDDTDPAVWDIVDAVYEEHFGGDLPGDDWDEPLPDDSWDEIPDEPWDEDPIGDDVPDAEVGEPPFDDDIAELVALDAALIAALEEAGIPFEIVEDDLGAYPVFDETDPAAWDVVDEVYDEFFGTDDAPIDDGWDEEWDDVPVDDGWDEDWDDEWDDVPVDDGWDEDWDDVPVDDGWDEEWDDEWDDVPVDDGWDEDWDDVPALTDQEIAEIQAEDAALMAALDAAGIPYLVEVDDIGPYPVFDEDDPDVQAFLDDYYG